MLTGRSLLITGVVDERSIATATLRRAHELGAKVVTTVLPRDLERATAVIEAVDDSIPIHPLDLTDEEAVEAWAEARAEEGLALDGALHAVAFAPRPALEGSFVDVPASAVEQAMRTSVWSYAVLARVLRRLKPEAGASLVGLDFDADGRAWPVYNWMGACKAALREASRYVARDLGPLGVRSNLVAAGPIMSRAAGGIPRFELLTSAWEATAPLAWDPQDAAPVADAVCFLLSEGARAITGEVLHVDGGYHAMAAPGAAAEA